MIMSFEKARSLLHRFKGADYLSGTAVLDKAGSAVAPLGRRAVLVARGFRGAEAYIDTIRSSLRSAGVEIVSQIKGAEPNAPREDVERITAALDSAKPDVIVSFGGGSAIDATKAAIVLHALGGSVDEYFGVGLVSKKLTETGKVLVPHVAIQSAASSGAHLTKYANCTDVASGQKKLIVDDAIVPAKAIFDYTVTSDSPKSLTADGALDGISHALEVLYGMVGKEGYALAEEIAKEAIGLVVSYLPIVLKDPKNQQGREALGLATDLGGYAIMVGGTNGGHLTSFSLVDILSHGRACAIMNPYYTVFFAPAIEQALRAVGPIFLEAGYTRTPLETLTGRELGRAVAEAMIAFERAVGLPVALNAIEGFGEGHITRALAAAKNPQLRMKLSNMPVPLTAETVDAFMRPVLEAAKAGDLSLIKTME